MSQSDTATALPSTGGLPVLLARAGQRAQRAMDAQFAPYHVSMAQFVVLAVVAVDTAATAGTLARELDMDSSAMTRLLDRMETAGIVARRSDPHDRRVVRVVLTERGQELLPTLVTVAFRVHRALACDRSGAELARFVDDLHAVLGNAVRLTEAS